ncbi:hypothetical protein G4B88_011640 [Cannabis sativa]|uniref:Uncharacterized protein n=1 Tax=Cannabis sativa TaxID=3483 RepID=A0A7J6DNL2_CANSA|nr:hypothetical protein G4B88_011640 [Cannabis sativa]
MLFYIVPSCLVSESCILSNEPTGLTFTRIYTRFAQNAWIKYKNINKIPLVNCPVLEENIPCNFLIVSAIRQGIVDDVVDCSHGGNHCDFRTLLGEHKTSQEFGKFTVQLESARKSTYFRERSRSSTDWRENSKPEC